MTLGNSSMEATMFKFATFLLTLPICCAPSLAQQASAKFRAPSYIPRSWEWAQERWTGEDAPYVRIRINIDGAIARGQGLEALARQYARVAAEKPRDPQAQFAWGYAAVLAGKPGRNVKAGVPRAVSEALARTQSPRTYHYARMRFVLLMTWGTWLQMKPLSQRLLTKNPNDYNVKMHAVRLLAAGTKVEQKQAVLYAQQLVRANPKRASAHSALGDAHRERWVKTGDAQAARDALQAYRRSLALRPNGDSKREDLKFLIEMLERRLSADSGLRHLSV